MKRCAVCNSTFVGDDQFCPNDGSILVSDMSAETPTVVLSTPGRPAHYGGPPAAQSSSSSKWMVPALGILCGLVVVLGFFAFYKQAPVAEAEKKVADVAEKKVETAGAQAPTATPVPPPPVPPPAQQSYKIATVNSPNDFKLSLKSDPCAAPCGKTLATIPHRTRLSIGTCKDYYEVADRKRGKWCYVSYDGIAGWIFDGFVVYESQAR